MLDRALQKPSWAWLRFVQLDRLDAERATLRIVPGHREVYGFATEPRLAQIGKVLQDVTGRRVRVTLDRETPASGGEDTAASPSPTSGAASDRREAMGLPLVRQALEIFPEASLIDVRDEDSSDPPKS
ncbi:hypothetical protein ACERK3_02095 [Phycisphaerales bacterium AB-hyl4]|uniref:DNA polymerase III subunit gamma/tau n=1 Tax=Natronomicrosphaera hydrolytica TaxID=3242702 RepID=A0ABV4U0F2_9BACT